MSVNYTPHNIFNHAGIKIKTTKGGWITVSLRTESGGGWKVIEKCPVNPGDYSDENMIPALYIADNVDVWTACRLLNDATNT